MFTPRSFGKVGVEAYAAYALRAWLAREQAISAGRAGPPSGQRSSRCARHGRAGRLSPDGAGRNGASTVGHHHRGLLPAGPGPGHGDRAGPHAPRQRRHRDTPDSHAGPSATLQSLTRPAQDQATDQRRPDAGADRSAGQDQKGSASGPQDSGITRPVLRPVQSQTDQARTAARELAATGRTVSRRVLRRASLRGSNETLNALARTINAELGGTGEG